MSPSILVRRDRFVALVAAIASSGCGGERAQPQTSDQVLQVASVAEPVESGAPPIAAEPTPGETVAVSGAACDNSEGVVDCSRMIMSGPGPAGEGGTASLCDSLAKGDGYKPRVAAEIARCWTKLGRRALQISARDRCNREATQVACPDPQYEPECQANIDKCKAQHKSINYTLQDCVLVLSSLDDRNRDWASRAMGPTREGCKLAYPVY